MRIISLYFGLLLMGMHTAMAQVNYLPQDSVEVEALLRMADTDASSAERLVWFGKSLMGRPYVGATLEGDTEVLTVNLRQFDCVTFVESVLALTVASSRGGSWDAFVEALRSIRYRNAAVDGYASRLHYFSEWIHENAGVQHYVEDVTHCYADGDAVAKPFFFMSAHAEAYPALQSDTSQMQLIRKVEAELSRCPILYLLKEQPDWRRQADGIESGSIVAFATRIAGLDVTHVGIVVSCEGKARLLHASSRSKKVLLESGTLCDYIQKQTSCTGIRVLRPAFR